MRRRHHASSGRRAGARAAVVGVLVAALVSGVAELAQFRPSARANEALRARLELLRLENERTERMIAEFDAYEREAERVEAEYAAALSAVPTEAELASALDDLERVTEASGVSLVRFAPTPLNGRPRPTTNASVPLEGRPIAVSVRCGFPEVRSLLERLAAYPRLLTVESFSLRSANHGRFTIEASLGVNCYYKKSPAPAGPHAQPKV